MLPLKKILCPIDFSEPSLAALDAACELAQHFDAELRVLNVLSPTPPLPTDLIAIGATDFYASNHELHIEALQNVNRIIVQHVPFKVRTHGEVKTGYAPQEIVTTADDEDIDIIVMGTHGTSGWRHLAFGSVAEKVVRSAHRPVLTVHCCASTSQSQEALLTKKKQTLNAMEQ